MLLDVIPVIGKAESMPGFHPSPCLVFHTFIEDSLQNILISFITLYDICDILII